MHLRFEAFLFLTFCLNTVVLIQCDPNRLNTANYATCTACNVKLLINEDELMRNLQRYKVKLKEKLEIIRFYTSDLQRKHSLLKDDPEQYLSNPLNAFKLISRMHSDWIQWQNFMKELDSYKEEINFIQTLPYNMPTITDLMEASAGIVRLQNTYHMSASSMSNGILLSRQYESRFSAPDCFVIGHYLLNETKFVSALSWFNASLDLYSDYDMAMSDLFEVNEIEIWNGIAMCHYAMGEKIATAHAITKALEYQPNHQNLLGSLELLQEFIRHDKLCRGEIQQDSKLFCRYNSTTSPFLKIAPLKMEEISIDPYIILYHDIVYDREIEELKRLSLPKLRRSLTGVGITNSERTTQVANVYSNKSLFLNQFNQRLTDMGGLIFSEIENLQVANYGMVGHYYSHVDHFTTLFPEEYENIGNRIATVLIYLNDVEKGGGTAFTAIKKVIQPKKGIALLWYHLDNSGNGIKDTIHASCPVIVGSKWMAIRFIHYNPQFLVKPCYK